VSIGFPAIEIEFPADMKWFKANINGTGFYRVTPFLAFYVGTG
jgi:hypothetical protein